MKNIFKNKNFIFFIIALALIILIFTISNSGKKSYSKNDVVISFEEETLIANFESEEYEEVPIDEDTTTSDDFTIQDTPNYDPVLNTEVGVVGGVTFNEDISVGIDNSVFDYTLNVSDIKSTEPNNTLLFFEECGYMDSFDTKVFTYFADNYLDSYTDSDFEVSDDFYNVVYADFNGSSVKIKGISYQIFKHDNYEDYGVVYIKILDKSDNNSIEESPIEELIDEETPNEEESEG